MRKFAVLFKQPLQLPRARTFDAASFKEALKGVGARVGDYEIPMFLIDFERSRCEMINRGRSGEVRVIEDGDYGELTDFERREY